MNEVKNDYKIAKDSESMFRLKYEQLENELAIEKQRIKKWVSTWRRLYGTVSTRSGLEGLGYKFENDKNENKKKDLKDIFVKASTDKPVEVSKTVSTNIACDEKVMSHEEKKTEKVFIKKQDKSNNDVKRTIADTHKKETS